MASLRSGSVKPTLHPLASMEGCEVSLVPSGLCWTWFQHPDFWALGIWQRGARGCPSANTELAHSSCALMSSVFVE